MNQLANFEGIAKYEKNGKSVYSLKFYFKDFETKIKSTKSEILQIENSEQKNLYEKLMSIYKLSHFQAKEVVRNYPIAYINETLEIAKIKKNQNVVKNI